MRIHQRGVDVVASDAELDAAAAAFGERGYLTLGSLLADSLLDAVRDALDRTDFYEREHHGIGQELCAVPGAVSGTLEFLFNDPVFTRVVSRITNVGPIGCFEGRVYRLAPHPGHYDSWHNDVGDDRRLACSLNLGRGVFEGGELQIRRAGTADVIAEVTNVVPGDAIVFKIDPAYEHRVGAVRGTVARTAYAGWFRTQPAYVELLKARLAARHG